MLSSSRREPTHLLAISARVAPQPLPVTLERRGRLLVATPTVKVSTLRTATVERTRRELAGRRGRR